MKYRPEIDGLRAVAVVPVILFHAGFSTFGGGFVGVDVFFVISGYLITTIILSEMDEGRFSLVNFYERRARRILPALFLIMLVSLVFSWFWLMPSDMKDFADSLMAVSCFSSNFLFWKESSYWDAASELKPLLHTWSLAVEEQYYVLFPLFLMLMWRFRKRWILSSFMLVAGISLVAAQLGVHRDPAAAFYLLPMRGWELAIGAGIAFYFLYRKQTIRTLLSHSSVDEAFGITGLLMIGYAVVAFDKQTPFPSLYALVPTVGAGLIILFSSSNTMIGQLLSSRPLVTVGLISYSAYLWHHALFAFARNASFPQPDKLVFAGLATVTFPLSYMSWKFVEKPFRNKKIFGRKTVFTFSLAGSLAFIGIGAAGHFDDGFRQRSMYTDLLVRNYQPDNRKLQLQSWNLLRKLSGDSGYGVDNNEYDRQPWFTQDDGRKKLLLVGNSHSKDIYNILTHCDYAKVHFQIARYGAQIINLVNRSEKMFDSPNYRQADIVMLVSRYHKIDLSALKPVVEKLISDHKKVVIVKSSFEFDYFGGKNLADHFVREMLMKNGDTSDSVVPEEVDRAYFDQFITRSRLPIPHESDVVIDSIAKRHSEVIVLDRMDYVCDKKAERCFSINDQFEKYFYDYAHNTLVGAEFFGERVDQVGWLTGLLKEQI